MNFCRFAVFSLIIAIFAVRVDAVEPITCVFDVENNDTLRLDVYRAERVDTLSPALIFAFGGGFKHGSRDDSRYVPFFRFLAENGVTVVSTDYRTMLKDASPQKMMTPQGFRETLTDAIGAAVTDFLKATAFTIAHAAEWGIDAKEIFACGSSAGAITALQAETALCNTPVPFPFLPEGFNYAGIVTFAGAVAFDGTPGWERVPAPMLLFQGDADSTVPFDKAVVGSYGLYGSKYVSDMLTKAGRPNRFHRFNGAGHEIAELPMTEDCGEVLDFIRSVCAGMETRFVKTTEIMPGKTEYKTDFTLEDYLRSNM